MLFSGSCLAYGFVTDPLDGFRYGYLMHVDENGDILSSETLPSPSAYSIRIVNPGDEIMQIVNPDALTVDIVLYDMQGRQVLQSHIQDELTEIRTTGLPAGIYPYALRSDGKVVASGKWVKRE